MSSAPKSTEEMREVSLFDKGEYNKRLAAARYAPKDPEALRQQMTNLSAIDMDHLKELLKWYEDLKNGAYAPVDQQGSDGRLSGGVSLEDQWEIFQGHLENWIEMVVDCFPDSWNELVVIGDENLNLKQHTHAYLRGLILHTSHINHIPESIPDIRSIMAGIFHDFGKVVGVASVFAGETFADSNFDVKQCISEDGTIDFVGIQTKSSGEKTLRNALRTELKEAEKKYTRILLEDLQTTKIEVELGIEFIDLTRGLAAAVDIDNISSNPISAASKKGANIQELAQNVVVLARAAGYQIHDFDALTDKDRVQLEEFFSYLVRHAAVDSLAYSPAAARYERFAREDVTTSTTPGIAEANVYARIFGDNGEYMPPVFGGIRRLGTPEVQKGVLQLREALGLEKYVDQILYVVPGEVDTILTSN